MDDFRFAMCHHKTRRRSLSFRNLSLSNELKLVEPREYENYFENDSSLTSLPPIEQYKQFLSKQNGENDSISSNNDTNQCFF